MGNLLLIKLQVCDLNFYLCVIYGPNMDCPEFYVNLKNRLMQKENLPVVICGDWNLVMDYSADTYGYLKENNIRARKEVLNMIEGLNLIDTWRSENNNSKKFTWVSGKKPLKMARLDFFLVTPDIHAKINKYIKSFGYRSDHSLIGIEIDVNSTERGKGFWKFNSSLLQDVEYVTLVKNEIKNVIEDLTVGHGLQDTTVISRQMFWEIQNKRCHYSLLFEKKKLQEQEKNLEMEIQKLEKKLIENMVKDNIHLQLETLKEELKSLRENRLRGVLLRARAQSYVDFEKPTKYFCNLEKQKYTSKVVNKVRTSNRMITNQQDILKELKSFYKNLLQSKRNKDQAVNKNPILDDSNIKKLSRMEQTKCEGLISENEIKKVLINMKNGKSPGTDGYTAEFYKFFLE